MVIFEFIFGVLDFILNWRLYSCVLVSIGLAIGLCFFFNADRVLAIVFIAVIMVGFAAGSTWQYRASRSRGAQDQ